MRVRVEVTPTDIKRGVPDECELCPIARATVRSLKKSKIPFDTVSVEGESLDLRKEGAYAYIMLPKKCGRFVTNFDNYGRDEVKPFVFTMNVPQTYLREVRG